MPECSGPGPRSTLADSPLLEFLESRVASAIFTVNALVDTIGIDRDITSLREAVQAAKTLSGADQIVVFADDLEGALILSSGRIPIAFFLNITAPNLNEVEA